MCVSLSVYVFITLTPPPHLSHNTNTVAIIDGSITVAQVLKEHEQAVACNQRMFDTIVGHHSTLSHLASHLQQGGQGPATTATTATTDAMLYTTATTRRTASATVRCGLLFVSLAAAAAAAASTSTSLLCVGSTGQHQSHGT